jgi:hypothetical protein
MTNTESSKPSQPLLLLLFWLYVCIPLAWGVWSTLKKALALFN